MTNVSQPMGLVPISRNGTAWVGEFRLYYVPSSQGTAIYRGDPLIPLGGSDAYGVPSVGLATAGATNYLVGSMCSVVNGPAAGANATLGLTQNSLAYHPASTAGYVLVADDPNQLFAVQEDSVGGALSSTTDCFKNADLIAGSGNATTSMSGWLLDSNTSGTGATKQLRILELLRSPDNAIGDYAKWVVRINLHSLWNTSGI